MVQPWQRLRHAHTWWEAGCCCTGAACGRASAESMGKHSQRGSWGGGCAAAARPPPAAAGTNTVPPAANPAGPRSPPTAGSCGRTPRSKALSASRLLSTTSGFSSASSLAAPLPAALRDIVGSRSCEGKLHTAAGRKCRSGTDHNLKRPTPTRALRC